MPLRRSLVHALDVIAYSGDSAAVPSVRIELHVTSGTYVRSIAQALGGHCTTLRRTAVGPFTVDESTAVDEATLFPAAEALGRLPEEALDRVPEAVRAGVLALDAPVGNGSAA
jgi:tRNA pseudouridine55 synthase